MVPCFQANPVLSSASDSPWVGLWPVQVSVHGLPNSDTEFLGAALTQPVVPCFYNPATELQNQHKFLKTTRRSTEESRKFILDRSVFDLVEAHLYLSLTDPRLINWYLSLSPEDRRIVQAEGGFHQFLQRHPALELSRHHVYVKYSSGDSRPVQPTSKQSVKSGAKTTRCEPPPTHLDLEMLPRDVAVLRCRNADGEHLTWTSSSSGLQEEVMSLDELSSSAAVSRDPSVLVGFSLDLDRCSRRPETRTQIPAAPDQNVPRSEAGSSQFRPSCDASVGTDLLLRTSTSTQTEEPQTSHKHIITEVHMSDLDYLAEEFIRMTRTEEQKEKMTRGECGCSERLQKAELKLLELHYNICRLHIWRLFWEGHQLTSVNKPPPPPPHVSQLLDKLASDYLDRKQEVLAGVPLEQLDPLSVDSGKIISGRYTPAQMVADELGIVSSRTSGEDEQLHAAEEHSRRSEDGSRTRTSRRSEDGSRTSSQTKKTMIKSRRAASLILKDGRFLHSQTEPRSELWFDAQEDLELPEGDLELPGGDLELPGGDLELPVGDLELPEEDLELPEVVQNPAAEAAEGSVLRVSNLPSDVSVRDLMLLLKDYEASEVRIISALNDHNRVAMVTVSGPQAAEAAVEHLDGQKLEDGTLHVEHIRDNKNLQNLHRPEPSENLQNLHRPEPSENLQNLHRPEPSENRPSSPGRTPLISSTRSTRSRKVVFISPTSRGTSVPQHYGTMGSLDSLMSELLQRHPEASRQQVVEALEELRRNHPGLLTGLPLQTIREMTSQILTRPDNHSKM